ncbi:MAG TPA: family 43 glycosylhydrolase [Actinomycetes bacterium]|nr:family 43 glycosylhydrolase [Actinomycetes bacterium]
MVRAVASPTTRRPIADRLAAAVLLLALCLAGVALTPRAAEAGPGTYTNPVSRDFADTFADPAVIKAKDGYWYAYGTTDPLEEGERTRHLIPISRSTDLVNWTYVGDAFTEQTLPGWADAAAGAALWAPDIRYLDGTYYLYYVVTQTTETPEPNDNAIGVATSDSPTGPWKDSGDPVVGPRRGNSGNPGDFLWTFDPSQFTALDGTRYLYYGSYYGGIWVTELNEDATEAVGPQTQVAIDNRYEGAYVIHHGGWYYLFASEANCCAGPTTGYTVFAGRSRSPRGPFVDRDGISLLANRVGGTIVVTPNGNRWVGTGHNAVITDLAGQDWFVYHAIDRSDPFLDEPYGINERPMLLDRLDWSDGWPTVRAGRWASEGPQRAPVTDWTVSGEFDLTPASCDPAVEVTEGKSPADYRAEGDLRLDPGATAAGLVTSWRSPRNYVVSWLDREAGALVTDVVRGGKSLGRNASDLPDDFRYDTWHNVAAELRGRLLKVEVTESRLNDPVAVQRRLLPPGTGGKGAVGAAARCGPAEAANLGAAPLYEPVRRLAPPPRVGELVFADGFNDGVVANRGWTWVRPDPNATETGGVLRWPTQAADLVGAGNDASVLLRDAPTGAYTVETRLAIDLDPADAVRNFQQAGLIAYVSDDHFLRLSHVAIWNTRQTEFGKEMPFAGRTSYGGMAIGTPAPVTWLRLSHRIDPANGEHEFRAASSRDGRNWTWGGVWTLPADTQPRIGLISHGGAGAVAEFDYVRIYRP